MKIAFILGKVKETELGTTVTFVDGNYR